MPEWVRVAALSECGGDGCVHGVAANGEKIVLVRLDDEVFALKDQCTHKDFPLSEGAVEDGRLECVFHGAQFDVRTGRAVRLPAIRPVKTFPVEIRDDEIYVQVD